MQIQIIHTSVSCFLAAQIGEEIGPYYSYGMDKELKAVGDLHIVPGPGNSLAFLTHVQDHRLDYDGYETEHYSLPLIYAREDGHYEQLHDGATENDDLLMSFGE